MKGVYNKVPEISHGELSCILKRHGSEALNEGSVSENNRVKSIVRKLIKENKMLQEGNYKKGREDALEKLLSEINTFERRK